MFQVNICSQQLEICKSVCMCKVLAIPHKNNCKKQLVHDMKETDSSIIIVRNVCLLTEASMIVYLFVTRSWSAIIGTKQLKVNQSPQQWRGLYTCTRICRFLVVGNICWLETKKFKCCVTRISFALMYGKTELSAVKYFVICS
jgi:hypothetical protein